MGKRTHQVKEEIMNIRKRSLGLALARIFHQT